MLVTSGWIRLRPRQFLTGLPLLHVRSCKAFWDSLTFIEDSSWNYSSEAAPLTALTSQSVPYRWSSTAERAFGELKSRFTSAPILIFPYPSRQFIVEVDASDTGVGGILSQRSAEDQKVHPCALFSRKLSPAERNYDVGNRELLALEEWRHWLEGAEETFVVWTDLKNLEYQVGQAAQLSSS